MKDYSSACRSASAGVASTVVVPSTIPAPAGKAAAGGDAALAKDTEAICDQAAKVTTQFGATFAQDLKQLIDSSAAENKQRRSEVEQKTKRDVQSFSFALGDLSRLAGDAEVKKALAAMSKDVTALNGDVSKIDADKLGELGDELDKACGRA